MARILVADDDPHIREVVRFALEQAGHDVDEVGDGLAAVESFDGHDLIVLDIMMPEKDGNDVCREIRAHSSVPIVFLSSRDDELDRVLGLELGGDDYITKPFSPRELVARVKAILRRAAPAETPADSDLSIGRLKLAREAFEARFGDELVELTKTEFELLLRMARYPNKVFTRADLMGETIVSDRTIDSHVRHIRQKFEEAGGEVIQTVHGVGYRIGACE